MNGFKSDGKVSFVTALVLITLCQPASATLVAHYQFQGDTTDATSFNNDGVSSSTTMFDNNVADLSGNTETIGIASAGDNLNLFTGASMSTWFSTISSFEAGLVGFTHSSNIGDFVLSTNGVGQVVSRMGNTDADTITIGLSFNDGAGIKP